MKLFPPRWLMPLWYERRAIGIVSLDDYGNKSQIIRDHFTRALKEPFVREWNCVSRGSENNKDEVMKRFKIKLIKEILWESFCVLASRRRAVFVLLDSLPSGFSRTSRAISCLLCCFPFESILIKHNCRSCHVNRPVCSAAKDLNTIIFIMRRRKVGARCHSR